MDSDDEQLSDDLDLDEEDAAEAAPPEEVFEDGDILSTTDDDADEEDMDDGVPSSRKRGASADDSIDLSRLTRRQRTLLEQGDAAAASTPWHEMELPKELDYSWKPKGGKLPSEMNEVDHLKRQEANERRRQRALKDKRQAEENIKAKLRKGVTAKFRRGGRGGGRGGGGRGSTAPSPAPGASQGAADDGEAVEVAPSSDRTTLAPGMMRIRSSASGTYMCWCTRVHPSALPTPQQQQQQPPLQPLDIPLQLLPPVSSPPQPAAGATVDSAAMHATGEVNRIRVGQKLLLVPAGVQWHDVQQQYTLHARPSSSPSQPSPTAPRAAGVTKVPAGTAAASKASTGAEKASSKVVIRIKQPSGASRPSPPAPSGTAAGRASTAATPAAATASRLGAARSTTPSTGAPPSPAPPAAAAGRSAPPAAAAAVAAAALCPAGPLLPPAGISSRLACLRPSDLQVVGWVPTTAEQQLQHLLTAAEQQQGPQQRGASDQAGKDMPAVTPTHAAAAAGAAAAPGAEGSTHAGNSAAASAPWLQLWQAGVLQQLQLQVQTLQYNSTVQPLQDPMLAPVQLPPVQPPQQQQQQHELLAVASRQKDAAGDADERRQQQAPAAAAGAPCGSSMQQQLATLWVRVRAPQQLIQ